LRDHELKQLNRTIERLYRLYKSYSPKQDMALLEEAVAYAMDAHSEQKRATGEPYIIHPLAVAEILTELEMDQETLCAALLHDTVEDTGITKDEIAERFGEDVANMVDGVTKLDKVSFHSKEELQAENFRKMFLAMAKDIRVVIIKLADRLHNMRTMKHLPQEKQKVKAQETLDIYAPLAHRLGIYKWKWELEDLCFRYLNTSAYYELVGSIAQRRSERETYLDQVVGEISTVLKRIGIEAEIEGRPKHFYSIYRKMIQKGKTIDEIYDLFACRIIVNDVADCYAVLGHVHEMYHPMPGRFKDYIATPKQNMYQSLHTTVIGPRGVPFEVQIRTFEMHRTAEFGIAAHYRYKSKSGKKTQDIDYDQKLSWLRQLLEWQNDMKDADEYLESLKNGLIEDDVYVFTPRGDVVPLPQGAVPIDFAYSIHSGVGNSMYGAKVDGRIVPLTYELKNGEIVEILTSDQVNGPSRDWLNLVKSTSAKSKIRHWFKREMRDEDIAHGKEIVEREIKKTGFTQSQLLKTHFLEGIMRRYNCRTPDDLFANIGHGTLSVGKVVPRLRDEYIKSLSDHERQQLGYQLSATGQVTTLPGSNKPEKIGEEQTEPKKIKTPHRSVSSNDYGIVVKGQSDCLVRLSRCCNPIPGDPIIGYTTRSEGIAVHRKSCPNIVHLLINSSLSPKDAQRAARLIEVDWNENDLCKSYEVTLKIIAQDRMKLLSDISNAIGAEAVSILSGTMSSHKNGTAVLKMRIEVEHKNQYDRVANRIKAVKSVIQVLRGN
jgi:guanosine-3',5'-bis(diphosphate) 3'-pyrophosphohydrolase